MDELLARANAALDGLVSDEWIHLREQSGEFYGVYTGEFGRRIAGLITVRREAEFIAAARELMPQLVAKVENLQDRLAAFATDCVHHGDMTPSSRRILLQILEVERG